MVNLFDEWNQLKQKINTKKTRDFYIKSREIWFTQMGINIGYEQNGKVRFQRPVLVLKKLGSLYLTVALTTKGKPNNYFYHQLKELSLNDRQVKHEDSCWAIMSQVKVMDKKRFIEKMGIVHSNEFDSVTKKLKTTWF